MKRDGDIISQRGNSGSLVMSGLPDSDGRSVCLNLIDIPPFNPHRLTLDDRLLDDRRLLHHNRLCDNGGLLNHDRLRHDRRCGLYHDRLGVIRTHQGRSDHAADNTADEARPEVASTRSPITAVVVMVATMPAVVITTMPPSMMIPPVRERTG